MSLPRRPSVGLPATPRARTFTVAAPPRHDIPPRPRSSASERPPPSSYPVFPPPPLPTHARGVRSHRSVGGGAPVRPSGSIRARPLDRRAEPRNAAYRAEPPPPLPSLPNFATAQGQRRGRPPVRGVVQQVDNKTYRSNQDALSDSSFSIGSDGSARSPISVASSRTSMDEAEMEAKDNKVPAGFGSSLWGSITGVAGTLTISVSKAWSSNIATYSGEETPVGGESRLTRAMKAYHIEKARNPSDLPDWLFDERERGVRSHYSAGRASEEKPVMDPSRPTDLSRPAASTRRDGPIPVLPPRVTRGPTLADRQVQTKAADTRAGSEEHVSKAMNRLRELRDAKRRAKVRFEEDGNDVGGGPVPPSSFSPTPVVRPEPQPLPPSKNGWAPPPMRPKGNMSAPLGATLGVRGRQPSTRLGLPSGVRPVRA